MTNVEIAEACRHWYPLWTRVMQGAWSDALSTVPLLGIPRRTERANIVHAAARDGFRVLCDQMEPILTLVEEREGLGLDYLVLDLAERKLAVRWGRYDGVRVNRNATCRQKEIQEQGCFSFAEDSREPVTTVTLGYTVEDDYTECGQPCWWLGRLVLIRERANATEFIQTIEQFTKPDKQHENTDAVSPRVVAREQEHRVIEYMAEELRSKIG